LILIVVTRDVGIILGELILTLILIVANDVWQESHHPKSLFELCNGYKAFTSKRYGPSSLALLPQSLISSPFVEMDEQPPSILASFTRTLETHVCGCDSCARTYSSCTPQEKGRWDRLRNSHNNIGNYICWFCGDCIEYYNNKETTRREGASLILILSPFFLDCC